MDARGGSKMHRTVCESMYDPAGNAHGFLLSTDQARGDVYLEVFRYDPTCSLT